MAVTQAFADAFAQEWIARWNDHNLECVLAHYTDDVWFCSPFIATVIGKADGVVIGKQALGDYWRRALQAYPDLHFELHGVFPGVSSLVLHYLSVKNLLAAEVLILDSELKVCRAYAHYRPQHPE